MGVMCVVSQSGDRAQLLEHLVECDMVIYDITEDPNSVDEAAWAIECTYTYATNYTH